MLTVGLYFLAGKLGLALATVDSIVSPVWPPTGLAIAAVVLFGPRLLPVVWSVAFLFNLTSTGTIATALGSATGNTLEAGLGGYVARRFCSAHLGFPRTVDVVRFAVLVCAGAPMLSATVGVLSLTASGVTPWTAYADSWFTWWLGDAAGALVVAPLILLWVNRPSAKWSVARALEATSIVVLVTAAGLLIFFQAFPVSYTVIPLVLWVAIRFGPAETIAASTLLNGLAVWGTVHGGGPFALFGPARGLLYLQGFIAVTTLTGWLLAAHVQQRRHAERDLRASKDHVSRLQRAQADELAQSRRRFAAFMEDLPGQAWIKDAKGTYVYCNTPFARLVGQPVERIVGRTDGDLFPAALVEEYRDNDQKVLQGRTVVSTVERRLEGDGIHHSLVRKFPILGESGQVEFVGGVAIDVTEERSAREHLERSQLSLIQAQEMAHIGSWEWDVATQRVVWSAELYRIFGLEPYSVPVTFESYLQRIHPEDQAWVRATIEQGHRQGEAFEFRHRIQRPDGRLRWLACRAKVVVGEDGKAARLFGTSQDVSERRLAEERFRLLFEASPDPMVIVDQQGRIVQVNEEAERLFGYTRDELLNQPVELLIPLPMRDGHVEQREAYLRNPSPRPMGMGRDLRAQHKSGREIPVEISLRPLQTESGLLVMSAIRDVTERLRVAQEREELQRLRAMDAFKTQFINMAAHELNTPLTPLKLQAHMLRQVFAANDAQRQAAEILERNVERVVRLVQNMLDVARIQSGRIELKRGPVELHGVLRDVAESFAEVARRSGVRLSCELEGQRWVHADPQRLGQVLFNLVHNALKFTPAGGHVTIGSEPNEDGARVHVRDTGPGLSAEQRARLFQPFSQVHAAASEDKPGTGLGLYISRQFVELHGGQLWVESPGLGSGSTFYFTLPGPLIGPPAPARPRSEATPMASPPAP